MSNGAIRTGSHGTGAKRPNRRSRPRVPLSGNRIPTPQVSVNTQTPKTRTIEIPMNLQELKRKTPAELLEFAESLHIENPSALRRQDMMFAILKQLAENDTAIFGDGVLEILQDGFGFLRSPEANYLPGPDDIY